MTYTITTKQAAKELDISMRGVQKLVERRRLDARKIGRDWFISRSSLNRYKKERRH